LASERFLWNSGMFCFSAGRCWRQWSSIARTYWTATRACLQQSRHAEGKRFSQLELMRKLRAGARRVD
jgi:mannose-1-phosphate guanylyltransferase/mannose-6-phosphate isomerase